MTLTTQKDWYAPVSKLTLGTAKAGLELGWYSAVCHLTTNTTPERFSGEVSGWPWNLINIVSFTPTFPKTLRSYQAFTGTETAISDIPGYAVLSLSLPAVCMLIICLLKSWHLLILLSNSLTHFIVHVWMSSIHCWSVHQCAGPLLDYCCGYLQHNTKNVERKTRLGTHKAVSEKIKCFFGIFRNFVFIDENKTIVI